MYNFIFLYLAFYSTKFWLYIYCKRIEDETFWIEKVKHKLTQKFPFLKQCFSASHFEVKAYSQAHCHLIWWQEIIVSAGIQKDSSAEKDFQVICSELLRNIFFVLITSWAVWCNFCFCFKSLHVCHSFLCGTGGNQCEIFIWTMQNQTWSVLSKRARLFMNLCACEENSEKPRPADVPFFWKQVDESKAALDPYNYGRVALQLICAKWRHELKYHRKLLFMSTTCQKIGPIETALHQALWQWINGGVDEKTQNDID